MRAKDSPLPLFQILGLGCGEDPCLLPAWSDAPGSPCVQQPRGVPASDIIPLTVPTMGEEETVPYLEVFWPVSQSNRHERD